MKSSANRTRFLQVRHLVSYYRYLLESNRTNLGVFYIKLPRDVPFLVRWERPTICAPAWGPRSLEIGMCGWIPVLILTLVCVVFITLQSECDYWKPIWIPCTVPIASVLSSKWQIFGRDSTSQVTDWEAYLCLQEITNQEAKQRAESKKTWLCSCLGVEGKFYIVLCEL